MRAGRVKIIRHIKIRGDANPYDPAWASYLEERLMQRLRQTLAGRSQIRYVWDRQNGRCVGCGELLREEEPWHLHHRVRRIDGGSDNVSNLELLHANCHRQRHSNESETEMCCVSQEAF